MFRDHETKKTVLLTRKNAIIRLDLYNIRCKSNRLLLQVKLLAGFWPNFTEPILVIRISGMFPSLHRMAEQNKCENTQGQ